MTTTRLITAEELLVMPDDGMLHELVKGELHTMPPPGDEHGDITFQLGLHLGQYVQAHRLGKVYAAETGFLLARAPDTVRAADVAFVRRDRLTPRQRGYRAIAPDLVAEVVSPSDSAREVADKVRDWLAAGTQLVLVVEPARRTLTVHRLSAEGAPTSVVLSEGDTLDADPVVPGWRLPMRVLFSEED
jgi:Uma2 family endonuclease